MVGALMLEWTAYGVAQPAACVYTPSTGTFNNSTTVTIQSTNATTIYYSFDAGVTWTNQAGASILVTMNGGTGIKAYGKTTISGTTNTSGTFTFNTLAPTLSVASWGTDSLTATISGTSTTTGATITYSTNGGTTYYATTPTAGGGVTVYGKATKTGYNNSAANTYTVLSQAAPTISPAAGTYNNGFTVTMTAPVGSTTDWSLNGSTWTVSGVNATTTTISTTGTTIYMRSKRAGYATSANSTATYTLTTLAPSLSPAWNSDLTSVTVSGSSGTTGATINYSTTSAVSGFTTTVPVLTVAGTVWAYASKAGYGNSGVNSVSYSRLAAPTITPAGGTYSANQSATITAVAGATADYYWSSWVLGSGTTAAYTVTTSGTLSGRARQTGYITSANTANTYTLVCPTPTLSVQSWNSDSTIATIVGSNVNGDTINYTKNGYTTTQPTVTSGSDYIAAYATRSGWTTSSTTANYYVGQNTTGSVSPGFL